jgi:hypothetical protein
MALIRRILLRSIGALVVVYAGDYAVLRTRLPKSLGTVTVHPYYAVPQKDGRTEFIPQDPQDQTCAQSLFPHMGYTPCWYLRRHTSPRIDM